MFLVNGQMCLLPASRRVFRASFLVFLAFFFCHLVQQCLFQNEVPNWHSIVRLKKVRFKQIGFK